ncbi:MAG: suppressor of fused domain protein [Clostridiales bacterium]|nr:suppressor of fused domain protein [Clostridiales bacterium]
MFEKYPIMYDEIQEKQMLDFIENEWGRMGDWVCHETESEYVHSDVYTATKEGKGTAFVTVGGGAREMNSSSSDFKNTEYAMYVTSDFDTDEERSGIICSELISLTKYPFRKNTWLGPGHTINASENFAKAFGYKWFLFMEHTHQAEVEEIGEVNYLNIIPVYDEEREWIVNHQDGSIDFFVEYVLSFEGPNDELFAVDKKREIIIPEE